MKIAYLVLCVKNFILWPFRKISSFVKREQGIAKNEISKLRLVIKEDEAQVIESDIKKL